MNPYIWCPDFGPRLNLDFCIFQRYTIYIYVVCCCKLNKTRDCDEHLLGQVSTGTGRYQLPIFHAHLCTSEATLTHNLGELYFDDIMSYNSRTTSTLNILFLDFTKSRRWTWWGDFRSGWLDKFSRRKLDRGRGWRHWTRCSSTRPCWYVNIIPLWAKHILISKSCWNVNTTKITQWQINVTCLPRVSGLIWGCVSREGVKNRKSQFSNFQHKTILLLWFFSN